MKMKMLSASSILVAILCSTFIFSCTKNQNQTYIPVSEVTLNKTNLSIHQGNSEVLIAKLTPATATNQTVTWKSSDNAIATVSSGKVTALAKGVTSIIATVASNPSKTDTCEITVWTERFTLTSTSFRNNEWMASKYAYTDLPGGGRGPNKNISPQLSWTGAPTTGVSKFIVMLYDSTRNFHHFSYEISPTITSLVEGDIPSNTNTNPGYIGPGLISDGRYHIYEFRVYAVSAGYDLDDFKQSPRAILKSKSAKYILAYSDPGYFGIYK